MLKKILRRVNETRKSEDGLTIAEVLVAFTIIVGVLLSTAIVMGYAFTSQVTGEGRNRAVQVARDNIEVARQVSFTDMAVTYDQSQRSVLEDGLGDDRDYNGEPIVILPQGVDSTLSFSPYEEKVVGQYSFRVWSYITQVKDSTFDGTAPILDATEIHPKRITVVVRWDSPDGEQEVVQSWVRNPSINECIPTYALRPSSAQYAPVGCAA
jgi:hypothetical protein